MFRTIVIVAAALLSAGVAEAADTTPVPVAPPQPLPPGFSNVQGYLGARYGGLWGDGSRLIDEKTAAATIPFRHGYMELEGRAAGLFMSGPSQAAALGAGHFYRSTAAGAWGVFGGYQVFPGAGLMFAGAEARRNLGRVVPYIQAAYAPAADHETANSWWARVGIEYFPTDNFMLQGDIRDEQGALDSWLVSGDAEWRRAGRPWGAQLTANYQTGAAANGGATASFLAGIKIHLGNSTLYQAYTTGAVWNVLPERF